MTVQIIEILRRSEQGVTRPFICRGDDDALYYVKGRGAGRNSLIKEWLAGRLAQAMGLPVAPFKLVWVPDALIDVQACTAHRHDLGAGYAFGSQESGVTELAYSRIEHIPCDLQAQVLIFDWWIRNGDRTLGEAGGNPNLLWDEAKQQLVVIDHNSAFDHGLDPATFMHYHAFASVIPSLRTDGAWRAAWQQACRDARATFDLALSEIPNAWWYVDAEQTVPASFDTVTNQNQLRECEADRFWPWER